MMMSVGVAAVWKTAVGMAAVVISAAPMASPRGRRPLWT